MPTSWPTNAATPPPGWNSLIDINGTSPIGWFTAAAEGMRVVVRGYPTWDDAPWTIEPDDRVPLTAEELDFDELDIELHKVFDIAYRGYAFPDTSSPAPDVPGAGVQVATGPPAHTFTNLDFVGGWRPPTGWPQEWTALLDRTLVGDKPASDLIVEGGDRGDWIAAARENGLGAVPYQLHGQQRLWVAPNSLADRVDRDTLTEVWHALIAADPDPSRRQWTHRVVKRGLRRALEVNLLQPITARPDRGLPHAWRDETTDDGVVMLGAVLGYPPASTYALLCESHGPVELPAVTAPTPGD